MNEEITEVYEDIQAFEQFFDEFDVSLEIRNDQESLINVELDQIQKINSKETK